MSCTKCKWYEPGDDYYGETMQKSYPAHCNNSHRMSNLKGFPFIKQIACFEPKNTETTESPSEAEAVNHEL